MELLLGEPEEQLQRRVAKRLRQDVAGTPGADEASLLTTGHALAATYDGAFLLSQSLAPVFNALFLGYVYLDAGHSACEVNAGGLPLAGTQQEVPQHLGQHQPGEGHRRQGQLLKAAVRMVGGEQALQRQHGGQQRPERAAPAGAVHPLQFFPDLFIRRAWARASGGVRDLFHGGELDWGWSKNLPLYFERQLLRADKVPNQQVSTPPTSA